MTHRAAAVMTVNLLNAADAARARLADGERGQGTVEYVGLILLVAGVLAAVVTWASKSGHADIGKKVKEQLTHAIDTAAKGRGN